MYFIIEMFTIRFNSFSLFVNLAFIARFIPRSCFYLNKISRILFTICKCSGKLTSPVTSVKGLKLRTFLCQQIPSGKIRKGEGG